MSTQLPAAGVTMEWVVEDRAAPVARPPASDEACR